jgi:hypothetical protein
LHAALLTKVNESFYLSGSLNATPSDWQCKQVGTKNIVLVVREGHVRFWEFFVLGEWLDYFYPLFVHDVTVHFDGYFP